MNTFWTFLLVLWAIGAICKGVEQMKDKQLRRDHPEVWMRQKELEAGEKQRKHERTKMGVGIGSTIGRLFLKKYLK